MGKKKKELAIQSGMQIDFEILSTASTKLSWSHFCEIMRVKTEHCSVAVSETAK
ncbi:MAG: hypothetical protein FWG03_06295 [Clostridiales bacterium]|nr:hypothetical protein [Clostridiales bacterium]